MAKKKKDAEKKVALQLKKDAKAEKASRKRLTKESKQQHQTTGGDGISTVHVADFDDLLEQYRKKDLNVSTTVLEPLQDFPLPRGNATLTLADDKNGFLYLFGGEYFDGVENVVLDELVRWDVEKMEWRQVITPPPRPAPRCAHSTVYYRNSLYVLAGELAMADQYHHYKDIWRFDCTSLKWEELQTLGTSPTARSGHAAFVWKHFMIVFGGFYEALRDTKWYNDLHVLDLQTLTWMDVPHSKLASKPEPRSACNVGLKENVAVIHGGFSKLKNPTTKSETKVHTDAWLLHLKPILQGKPPTWERLSNRVKGSNNPSNRSGTSSVTYKDLMLVYGGVVDTEQYHHRVDSVFYNELYAFDMERRAWFPLRVKSQRTEGKSRRRRRKKGRDLNENDAANSAKDQEDDDDEQAGTDEESSDLDLEDEEEDSPAAAVSGWDLDRLRSNMFAFIDGEGNIVYEKIQEEEEHAGYEADGGESEAQPKEEEGVINGGADAKEDDTDEDEDEAKGDDTDDDDEEGDGGGAKLPVNPTKETPNRLPPKDHVVSSSSVMKVNKETGAPEAVVRDEPLPRINATVIVRNNVLYVYGGLLEVGDREVTLDDCWSFDLRKRDKWECLWSGTMHKQVWRGAAYDDDDSYISTGRDDDEDDEEDENDVDLVSDLEMNDEEARRAAKAERKAAKKEQEKSKRAGLRQEIADLKGQLDLDDANRTPQIGEALADFYSRTCQYWNDKAAVNIAATASQQSESERLSGKELKREGFKLASERYHELISVLVRLEELEPQQRETEEDRKTRKETRKGKKGR